MSDIDADNPDRPQVVRRRIQRLPYAATCVPAVADLLGGSAGLADFRLPGAEVHQITLPGERGAAALMLTLWPSIRRVDAIGPGVTVVFTDVATVELVEGVEVLFRRSSREYLIVTRAAKVIVRA